MTSPADIADLARRFGRAGAVAAEWSPLGGPVMRLTAGTCETVVAIEGAQVLEWRQGGQDMLWLSPVSRLGAGRAPRGGIPVCWPWFGPHPDDTQKPQHGFARRRDWQVVASSAHTGHAAVTLEYATGPADAVLWPHAATVQLTVSLGDGLQMALTTTNTGTTPFALTEALHTYFRVGDVEQVSVEGLEGRAYLDKLEGYARKHQAEPVAIAGEVDRIYGGDTGHVALVDTALGRRISIRSGGSRSAVVWNPWAQRTAELGDMGGPDAFRQMLCIETANAGDDIVRLAPGQSHRLTASYDAGPA